MGFHQLFLLHCLGVMLFDFQRWVQEILLVRCSLAGARLYDYRRLVQQSLYLEEALLGLGPKVCSQSLVR